jgi:hypothetical protein
VGVDGRVIGVASVEELVPAIRAAQDGSAPATIHGAALDAEQVGGLPADEGDGGGSGAESGASGAVEPGNPATGSPAADRPAPEHPGTGGDDDDNNPETD